jgi:acyl dehydratase
MTRARLSELSVGLALPTLTKPPIERIQLVRYAGASGDFNRIHVEEGYAQAAGYKGVFAHGMLVMGFFGQLLTNWLGTPAPIARLSCRFRALTWPGDVLTISGRVSALIDDTEPRRATLALEATNQDGMVVADGSAEITRTD